MNALTHNSPDPLAFGAALTMAQVEEREKSTRIDNRHRRMMLAVLTRSGQQLYDGFSTDADGSEMVAVVEAIKAYEQQLQFLLELSGVAIARVVTVASVILQQDSDADAKGGL
ncbi:MAG: hypothetical protein U1E89_04680 [Burkholderiaceae bacterium]